MFERYLHHPGFHLAVPAAAIVLVYYFGNMAVDQVNRMPVKNIAPSQKSRPLADISLPTVYAKGNAKAADALSADFDRAFGVAPVEKEVVAEKPVLAPPPPPPAPVEPPLASYFMGLNITGVGSDGIFIDDVFRKFGEPLAVSIPKKGGVGLRSVTLVGLGAGVVMVAVDGDKVELPLRF